MRIYLDNSATSWPKPEVVYAAVDRYQREVGTAAGRGGYADAAAAQRTVDAARREVARLIGAPNPNHIITASNGTDALNLAIHGVLRPGDHVVATVCDHNSVLRPLADEARLRDVQVTYVGCNSAGLVDPDDVRRAIRANTRLVNITHSSNVTGAIQPLADIAPLVKAAGKLMLVDASQSLGHVAIDVAKLDIDLLAASGHKGLLGPAATGILYIREGVEDAVHPIRQGGTGVESQLDHQPRELPTRFESGSLNGPGLAGLAASVGYLHEHGKQVADHEAALTRRLIEELSEIAGVRVYGPPADVRRGPVVSFSVEGYDPQEVSAALDSAKSIQCRAGLHCAPKMHEALGTTALGGLVRMSLGWATTAEEIDVAIATVAEFATA
jgi:cysteine desulfurase/selenocysteine lyase